jgi:hypothetical protein
MMKKIDKLLILLLMIALSLITALHKFTGDLPPEWFVKQFSSSLIGKIPFGIPASYFIISTLELAIAIVFILSIVKMEFKSTDNLKFSEIGFNLSLILFLILFFGSFLIENYENGFIDFGYFVFTIFLKNQFNKKEERI